jgi:hypothetical protein
VEALPRLRRRAGRDPRRRRGVPAEAQGRARNANDYKARLKRSDFFNGTWRTIAGLGGMAFRKPPTVEVPSGIEPYLDDVTWRP